jgi:hypothetical protein
MYVATFRFYQHLDLVQHIEKLFVGVVLATIMPSAILKAQKITDKIASILSWMWTKLNRYGILRICIWRESVE